MERNRVTGTIVIALLLGVAACAGKEDPGDAALAEDATMAVPAAPATTPDATMPAAAPVSGGATVTVANSPEYGSYLADGQGRALYLFTSDEPGESSCMDACAQAWPPFVAAQGTPSAGAPAVNASLLSTLQRADGSTQVVYDQHPLYYFQKDAGPGQTTGQDVHGFGGEWYLVTPQGEKLEEED